MRKIKGINVCTRMLLSLSLLFIPLALPTTQSVLQRPQLMRFRAFNLNLPLGKLCSLGLAEFIVHKSQIRGHNLPGSCTHASTLSGLKQILNTLKLTYEVDSNK